MTLCFVQPDNGGFGFRSGKSFPIGTSSRFETVFAEFMRCGHTFWPASIPVRQEGERNLRYRSAPTGELTTLSGLTPHSASESVRHLLLKRAAAGDPSFTTQPSRFARAKSEAQNSNSRLVSAALEHDRTRSPLIEKLANWQTQNPASFNCLRPQGIATCF